MATGARLTVIAVILSSFLAVHCGGNSAGHSDRGTGSTGNNGTGSTGNVGSGTGSTGTGNGPGICLTCGGSSMRSPDCGNKTLDAAEECDDGNAADGDGCNQTCRIEADCVCSTPGAACTCSRICGDGVLSSAETCDDGNTTAGDGCSADCKTVEPNFQCRVPGKKCVPICGDMVISPGENCDDGNTMSLDGCSSTCLTEPGWDCSKLPCTKAVCGNGMKEVGESCDKGAENGLFLGDATGCSKTCTQEPNCREGGVTGACKTPCGDGNVDPGEECDDGNGVKGDGCSDMCKAEGGFMCTGEEKKDTQPCTAGGGECLVLPITYRDFDSQKEATGHPDFFSLGGATTCVPNASGQTDPLPFNAGGACWTTDSTKLCSGLVNAALGADGKPALSAATTCACRFTDWDQSGVLDAAATAQNCTVTGDGSSRKRIDTTVQVIKSADTFKQWYHDSTLSTKVVDKLELAQLAAGNQYQFSSSMGRTVYDDIHDIFMGTGVTSLSSGFFPLEAQTRPKVCNIWPYWVTTPGCIAATTNAAPAARSQWDPRGSYTAGMAGTGGPVVPVAGVQRNFYFSSEVRYLFRYVGGETLAFYGDDDVWVFVNGKLVLDLGAPHERLQGSVALTATGATWTIQGQNITTNMAVPVGTGTVAGLGLEAGKTYEIAVFHADRHPRESNYQLTLSGFSTTRSVCQPRCGDSMATATEECDAGPENNDTTYGGCTTQCKVGPFCGDNVQNGPEECDLGRMNTAHYGEMGCTAGCKVPHRCGDKIIDTAFGESCDDGDLNGTGACQANCTFKPL